MSSSLLLQQCLACFVCPIWKVLEMGCRCPYNCCFVECYFQDLFNIARSILVQLLHSFSSVHLINVHVVYSYYRIDTTKRLRFILSNKADFHTIDNLSMVDHAFASRILMSFSVNKPLLPRYANLSTDFREPPFKVEIPSFWLTHMYSILSAFTWRPIPPAAWDSKALCHLRSLRP